MTELEEKAIGTKFPFLWNAKEKEDWCKLMRTANPLGGRIHLDDSDKIQYSAVRRLLDAEAGFIRTTRQAQSTTVNGVLDQLENEDRNFRDEVRRSMEERRKQLSGEPDTKTEKK